MPEEKKPKILRRTVLPADTQEDEVLLPQESLPLTPYSFGNRLKRFVEWYGIILALVLAMLAIAIGAYNAIVLPPKIDKQFATLSSQVAAIQKNFADPGPTSSPLPVQVPEGAPRLGSSTAPVTIVEFADFQCPFCEKLFKTVLPELKTKYIDTGKASLVFQDFAFLGPESTRAAEAAKCAGDQGKFWDYHDKLYNSQGSENSGTFSDQHLKTFAQNLKLNSTDFNACLDSNKYADAVAKETSQGQSFGVSGTPTLFINGTPIAGVEAFSVYQKAIDALLAK